MWKDRGYELWSEHKGKLTGLVAGLLLGIIYLIAGFWDMLVFAFLLAVGYWIGKLKDRGISITELLLQGWKKWNDRWKMFR
ncbi:DUF2273 domain-containing protein [Marinicrinis sediminis]|uniref:DUF2273 domain-containing protein n=1 Tax=Marinicrinis sediminis TaxID=1652465 RepID=A0ABW5RDG6_9BACL